MQLELDKDIPKAMHIILERWGSREFTTKLERRQGNSIFSKSGRNDFHRVAFLLPVANVTN